MEEGVWRRGDAQGGIQEWKLSRGYTGGDWSRIKDEIYKDVTCRTQHYYGTECYE